MKARECLLWVLAGGLLLNCGTASGADKRVREITVAAAADLNPALKEIAADFEKASGVRVKISFGASGSLTHEIENRAPFDVFLSADMEYPKRLIAEGDAEAASYFRYATGKLVLWTLADSPLDVEHGGMSVLANSSVKKIAIANPQRAPYGQAAVAAMKHVQIYDQVQDRLVTGENVSQAAEFVLSGNAQAGFIALSEAMSPGMQGKGKYWVIPVQAYPALDQAAVLVAHSRHKKEAEAFLTYLKTDPARDVLKKFGFAVP